MITPARIRAKYIETEPYLEPLKLKVRDSLQFLCDCEGYALVSRLKTIESACEKVETGRFSSWVKIDDLVAFTVVVPTLTEEPKVLAHLSSAFTQVELRPRGSSKKAPDTFRFDATRFIGKLVASSGENAPLFHVPFEVQIRSAFEHAWSVTTHALSYKTSNVSWSTLRLAAQLKAAVEQLDTLIGAFEHASKVIQPSVWPEIQAKEELKSFFEANVNSGAIPEELTPKDWSRFVDNIYDMTASGLKLRKADARPAASDISMVIRRDVAAELAYLGPTNMPRSISLGQFAFASLLKAGSLKKTMRERYPLITPEMEDFYPMAKAITQRFDYT